MASHLIFPVFSYGDNLFIGTAQGCLLQYTVATRPGGPPDVQFLRANKNFSRQPITQISVVPEDEILVTIREGMVSVHDISETHIISFSFVMYIKSRLFLLFCRHGRGQLPPDLPDGRIPKLPLLQSLSAEGPGQ